LLYFSLTVPEGIYFAAAMREDDGRKIEPRAGCEQDELYSEKKEEREQGHQDQSDTELDDMELGLGAALALADKFESVRETMSAILYDVWQRSTASSTAETQATAGRFCAALPTLGFHALDEYVEELGKWRKGFEHITADGEDPHASYLRFLLYAVRIVGWIRPDWREVFEHIAPTVLTRARASS
jgi:hypothetical protein